MRVFRNDILVKKSESPRIGRSRQADHESIEVVEHLFPQVVNAAMAFIDDDKIEKLDGYFVVVADRDGFFRLPVRFVGVVLFGALVELFVLQDRIQPLDRGDAHLAIGRHIARVEPLHVVEFGEFALVVVGLELHKLLLGLFAQIPGIDQKEYPFGIGEFQQPVDRGDGRESLPRAGRHLDQRFGPRLPEGLFQVGDGVDLAKPEMARIQGRDVVQARAQRLILPEPFT